MVFDPKRAARVGAKKLRQRQESRIAKRQIIEDLDDSNLDNDVESDERDFRLNLDAEINRKWKWRE